MKPADWRRVYDAYQAACDLLPRERQSFLDSIGARPEVVAEVIALLEQSDNPGDAPNPDIATADNDSLVNGAAFDRFVLLRVVGRGAMGDVYAARDPELDRTVALKFLNSERVGMRSAVNRFVGEAKAASALNHPNIVTVYEVLHAGFTLAIAMELVEGQSLREFCHQAQPVERIIRWGRQMAAALAAAHAQGIIHRDIKPENIMVRPDDLIKVLDFGLARHLTGANQTSSAGLPVGTLRYMSPEQTRGDALTEASDMFSLGMVLYELATGHHPFAADSPFATAYNIAAAEPPAPSSLNDAIPAELESLILSMLAKDLPARPTAEQVAERLSGIPRQRRERLSSGPRGGAHELPATDSA